jgi:hypothetical protein
MVAALAVGFALGRELAPPAESLDEAIVTALSPSAASAVLATGQEPPDGSVAFATLVEP